MKLRSRESEFRLGRMAWGSLITWAYGIGGSVVSSSPRAPGNEPFGSRQEPGIFLIAYFLLPPPGEVPEGRARGVQDTATRVQSESET